MLDMKDINLGFDLIIHSATDITEIDPTCWDSDTRCKKTEIYRKDIFKCHTFSIYVLL